MLMATFVEMWLVLSSGKNITSKSFGMQGVNLQKYNPLVEETLSRLKDDIAIKPSLPSSKDYSLHLSGILDNDVIEELVSFEIIKFRQILLLYLADGFLPIGSLSRLGIPCLAGLPAEKEGESTLDSSTLLTVQN